MHVEAARHPGKKVMVVMVCWSRSVLTASVLHFVHIIHCFDAYTSTPSRTALHHVADLPDLYTALVAYLQASHSCTCHTCIPTFPKPPCMHIYILAVFPAHNSACAISFTHACACRTASTCINHILTSPHIHYSDEPNAIIFIQVLALSHIAQVLI